MVESEVESEDDYYAKKRYTFRIIQQLERETLVEKTRQKVLEIDSGNQSLRNSIKNLSSKHH